LKDETDGGGGEGRAEAEEVVAGVAAYVDEQWTRGEVVVGEKAGGDGVDGGVGPGGAAEAVAALVVVELGVEGRV